jgi:hypothetical protein
MDGDYVVTAKSGRKRMQKMIDMEELEKGNIMIAEFIKQLMTNLNHKQL